MSVPIGMVAHWQFCPRRAWLEGAGERAEYSGQMADGTAAHRRVDEATTRDAATVRAVDVRHRALGFHGRIDRVEMVSDTVVRLIEHKATPVKREPRASDTNRLQLTLQAMALEDQGFTVASTELYFSTHHRRVPIEIDEVATANAIGAVEATRAVLSSATAPEPLIDDPKCMRCSHSAVCLPEERQEQEVRRRIMPPDPAGDVLHLTTPGSRAQLASGRVTVVKGDEKLASIPMERVLAVVVHGNVDVSGALLRELMWRDLPIVWCTGYGRVVGWSRTASAPNGSARHRQFAQSHDGRIDLAREFVASKLSNQATILRRFGGDKEIVQQIRDLARAAKTCTSTRVLFGIEGNGASLYFGELTTLLGPAAPPECVEDFTGRVGRGAIDPLNSALNYGYGLLLTEVLRGIIACGLDPSAGFLHSPGRNKPALALDLMEEFRAPLVDAAIIGALNNGELKSNSFTNVLGSYRLTPAGRKKLIAAFERRVATEFTHPVFGYRTTWRRAIEIQARMVLGVIDGSQQSYKGVTVR
ncbi:MAG: CRISPR-associated endonuclease Cas1 [Dermabacter sp.]|nr:CRISPR-associated endonuclease Cas1 [Dermabacter sp.]